MEESLLLSCQATNFVIVHILVNQLISLWNFLVNKEPLNGREKKKGETTKYLYFSNFFDSKNSPKKLINVKLTKVLQYIVC
jgi:hypothetical protein